MFVTTPAEIFTAADRSRVAAAQRRRPEVRLDGDLCARMPAAAWAVYLEALDLPDLAQRVRTRLPLSYSDLADPPDARRAGSTRHRRAS
ncbi:MULTISPECIES: hypothetical protein [Gordonia]|uniref:Uncharacterized protein n=1 Tax=Gordonia terrae C-6 TaxID=1316928 RepID=R7Y425_9ACTN|nr:MULTISPECIES: hypothetical protein [Gordonia]EON30722.1 hypothetical protein GTC6_21240 [Gordonia terrae C-6]